MNCTFLTSTQGEPNRFPSSEASARAWNFTDVRFSRHPCMGHLKPHFTCLGVPFLRNEPTKLRTINCLHFALGRLLSKNAKKSRTLLTYSVGHDGSEALAPEEICSAYVYRGRCLPRCDETHTSIPGLLCFGSWPCVSKRPKKPRFGASLLSTASSPKGTSLGWKPTGWMVNARNYLIFLQFCPLDRRSLLCLLENGQAPCLSAECDFNHTQL